MGITKEEFTGKASDQVEMAAALGGMCEIAGMKLPAPSAAVIALLDAIQSPYMQDESSEVEITRVDVARTLYIIGKRKDACLPIMRLMRRKEFCESLSDSVDETLKIGLQREIADAQAELDVAAVDYIGDFVFNDATASKDIGRYLMMCTGLSMIPTKETEKKNSDGILTT